MPSILVFCYLFYKPCIPGPTAAYCKSPQLLRVLAAAGASIQVYSVDKHMSIAHWAVLGGDLGTCVTLKELGVSLTVHIGFIHSNITCDTQQYNMRNKICLSIQIARRGSCGSLMFVYCVSQEVDIGGLQPIHYAAQMGHTLILDFMVVTGGDIEATDKNVHHLFI